MHQELTKDDFNQIDSHWIYIVDGLTLDIAPDKDGNFKLTIYGTLDKIPPATRYPTEPEWDFMLALSNKFRNAFLLAKRQE